MPPDEIPFEEFEPGLALGAIKGSALSRSRAVLVTEGGQNLFQKKRDIEKQLQQKNTEIANGMKEVLNYLYRDGLNDLTQSRVLQETCISLI